MKLYRMLTLLIAAVLLMPGSAIAQGELRKANRHYEKMDYALAIPLYLEHFKTKKPDEQSALKIAHCYRLNNNYEEAENWYRRAIALGNNEPQTLWHYGQMLKSNGEYEEAKKQFEAYAKANPADEARAKEAAASCSEVISWFSIPATHKIKNVEQLNTESAEFSPLVIGKGMLLSSDRVAKDKQYAEDNIHGWSGRPFVRLYYTEEEKNKGKEATASAIAQKGPMSVNEAESETEWKEAILLSDSVNREYHSGSAAYDEKKGMLFFTRTKKVKVKQGEKYSDPMAWPGNAKPRYINRLEIYTAEKKGEGWVNVRSFEHNNSEQYSIGHPAVSSDGKTLYFSSDMAGGYGGTDIYYCELNIDGTWGKPVNAGPKINTPGRESFPTIKTDGTLYFSSDGHRGMGGLDLFSAKGNKNSWNDVTNLKYPFNSPKDDFGIVFANDSFGYFSSDREGGKGLDDIYSFEALKPAPAPEPAKPVKVEFPAVYFDFDKSQIRKDAAQELDKVVKLLEENASVFVEVSAHCDCRGSSQYNMVLSQRRARSVADYLILNGIESRRLVVQGYGESKPVNGCVDGASCSEQEHQANRRTEFRDISGEAKPIKD